MSTNENVKETNTVSKSQKKRADREKKKIQEKREGVIGSIIGILAIALILGGIIWSITAAILKKSAVVEPTNDYSKYVTDEGFVEGVKASSITTLPTDYKNIVIPKSEVEYTDEMFEEEKASMLESHKILNEASEKAVESGDTVNIDYVGLIDGVEFSGGNSGGQGADLEIGSGTYIPGFEDQIIGHKAGDGFDVVVTFPEDYGTEDLAGKEAVFKTTLNGIYEEGEFTDEFVAENLRAYATSVDEYRKYVSDEYYDSKVDEFISSYIKDNTTVSKYPNKYIKHLIGVKMYSDQSSFQYMNQMYQQMYGYGYSSFEEYNGMSTEEYSASCEKSAKESALSIFAVQAIAEKEGISVSDDDIKAYVENMYGEGSYETELSSYGKPYLAQNTLENKVYDYLKENATIQ